MAEIFGFIKEYGFPAVVVVFVLWQASKMGWKIVCSWIDSMNVMVIKLEESNKRWQVIVDRQVDVIEKHTQANQEAHLYQRNEHIKLTEQQEQQIKKQDKQIEILVGIEKSVSRINGYK